MSKLPAVRLDPMQLQPLPDLDPKLREAIRLYTDPLMPTFGNKQASCVAVGYADGQPLQNKNALAEIQRIAEVRAAAGAKVADFLSTYAWDAARELVNQMSTGRDLKVTDVTDLLREASDDERLHALEQAAALAGENNSATKDVLALLHGERMTRADLLTKANRVALQAAKERREALELVLRYHLGHPEHRVRHTHEGSDPLDLSQLSNEELSQLGDVIADVLEKKKGAAPKDDAPLRATVLDADAVVED